MKKKTICFLCVFGLSFFCLCMKSGEHDQEREEPELEETIEEEETFVNRESEQHEEISSMQKQEMAPEKVLLEKPVVQLNGEEGVMSYRWGYDCISIDGDTVLFSCDVYFPEEKLQQKIFYLVEAPEFIAREVFRQNTKKELEDTSRKDPELLEERMVCPILVHEGYIYEANGSLYCLSEDFRETVFVCDIRELMGGLYEFSPWVADKNKCDVTEDASRLLACTDEGLYEYDLKEGEAKLLEPAVLIPKEIIHIEGDCDCGETGFEFSGPIEAEYAPDNRSYAFLTGEEYGSPVSVTLRREDGKTLYQKELKGYMGDFEWQELEDAVYLAVFYREEGNTWMDRVDVNNGEKTTFAVPDDVFFGTDLYVGFFDADSLIYYKKYVSNFQEISRYEVYQLYSGKLQKLEFSAEDMKWRVTILKQGGYRGSIVKYPDPDVSRRYG